MDQDQQITAELLDKFGIAIPNDMEKGELIKHLNETLSERISTEIAKELDEDQLKQMLAIWQAGNQTEFANFLRDNVPDFAEIAGDERDILLGEIADNAEKLNEIAKS